MKHKFTTHLVRSCVVFLFAWPVHATTLSLQTSANNVAIGETFSVELKISDLADQAAPSLGSFFAEIVFDENLINVDSVTFGKFLGDPNDLNETDIVITPNTNKISLEEISFLTTTELDTLQPADFTLATLLFRSSKAGLSTVSFGDIDFSDADANSFIPALEETSINVIPLPGALILFLSAFIGMVVSVSKSDRL